MPDGMQFPVTPGPGPEPPTGTAGGALTGNYPNPQLVGGPLNLYLPLTGGTLSGPLVVSIPGATSSYIQINHPTNNANRPVLIFAKQGVTVGQISAEGVTASLGGMYYEAIGVSPLHDFFVGGTLMLQVLPVGIQSNGVIVGTSNLVVGANVAGIQHNLKMGNNATLAVYSNAANQVNVEAFQTSAPTTKYTLAFNQFGGGATFGGNVAMAGTLQVTSTFVGLSDVVGVALWSQTTGAIAPVLWLQAQGNPLDAKLWKYTEDATGLLHLQAINDATSIVQSDIIFRRDGTMSGNGVALNSQPNSYAIVAADSGKFILHGSAGAVATYTIPANASVPFPVGTQIEFVNASANALTIAITTDTLTLSPGGTAGSRTLAQFGHATALKIATTLWYIWGTGLT